MRYMLLLYNDESAASERNAAELEQEYQAYGAFTQSVTEAGALHNGDALQPSSTATVVRANGGAPVTTDGPYAETKEQLGGFYILDCRDLDEAIEWAGRIPAAQRGAVEIRPVRELG